MVHWARFPAFRHVRHELKKPHLTMKDADRGAVFMRWKEKFLVPDHRVQDISGASFAGECARRAEAGENEEEVVEEEVSRGARVGRMSTS